MATMLQRAQQVLDLHPDNPPLHPNRLAVIWFSEMDGFNSRPTNHNGGLRKGATCALGLAARMAKKGYMKRWDDPTGFLKGSYWQVDNEFLKNITDN